MLTAISNPWNHFWMVVETKVGYRINTAILVFFGIIHYFLATQTNQGFSILFGITELPVEIPWSFLLNPHHGFIIVSQ